MKLAHWLSHSTIFGPHDKIVQDLTEAWCIAKMRRLVGSIDPPVNSKYEEEFALAEYLETSSFTHRDDSLERQFITVGTLRQELEKVSAPKVSPELLDLIDFLLVIDPSKRPTAVEALQHPYLNECSSSSSLSQCYSSPFPFCSCLQLGSFCLGQSEPTRHPFP